MAEQARRIDHETTTAHPPPLRIVEPAPEPATVTGLPDPATTARALGLCVAEVLTGAREVDSIARWISDDVQRHLQQRAAVAAHARGSGRRARGRPVLRVGSVLVCRPAAGVAEATVVVHARSHARAVAMRLEERHGRWQATAIGVL
ncbi:Rv3235 family protein [Curtobacterium flaccumfaciens]|uniref:Rv3235 family protein n=1 Tax=Curtobacterium TaxID=2034 RepID=UPI000DA850AF|nr:MULTISPECIES: Rv3235 family protein [Curtobacterium]MCS6557880.1 Rv3235 family protein [Curtobacterium flaccumfaciens]PZE70565.1 3-hydroxyacyl-CoA dehydrogenase [Curtobacterium sp. MCLR17_059]PZF25457.1 3-hydroxyacyl-CoA dehydrogenase [Curtobacterium sp. MCLR17_045]PZF54896.1 3-hydroxyacyl-CoA dehydrogenase [Curtobacterium sp. MCLR17_057]